MQYALLKQEAEVFTTSRGRWKIGLSLIKPGKRIRSEQTEPRLPIFETQISGGLGVSRKTENTGFICVNCGKAVTALTNGSYRNHCPYCLYSLHVDNRPGDRMNGCGGVMKPVGIKNHSKKGWQIVHRCLKCAVEKVNRAAPDDMEAIINMAKINGPM